MCDDQDLVTLAVLSLRSCTHAIGGCCLHHRQYCASDSEHSYPSGSLQLPQRHLLHLPHANIPTAHPHGVILIADSIRLFFTESVELNRAADTRWVVGWVVYVTPYDYKTTYF